MDDPRYRWHDVAVKWVTVGLSIIGFAIAVWTYIAQQEASREQARREYKLKLWERQFDLYAQASRAASTLATASRTDSAEYLSARARFDELYYGEMCIVESPEVEGRMISFRTALVAAEADSRKRGALKNESLALARACRASTESAWKVELGTLTGKPAE